MAISEAKKRANAKWDSENMATIACKIRRDDAEAFKGYCQEMGKTANTVMREYVFSCIGKDSTRSESLGESVSNFSNTADQGTAEGSNAASVTPEASDVKESVLTVEAAKTAREAAELSGETVPAFVERAVKTQSERDKVSYRLNAKIY